MILQKNWCVNFRKKKQINWQKFLKVGSTILLNHQSSEEITIQENKPVFICSLSHTRRICLTYKIIKISDTLPHNNATQNGSATPREWAVLASYLERQTRKQKHCINIQKGLQSTRQRLSSSRRTGELKLDLQIYTRLEKN